MPFRRVAVPRCPSHRPRQSQDREDPVHGTPAVARHQGDHDPGGHREPDSASEHHDGLRPGQFVAGEPARYGRRGARKRPRLPAAEKKADCDERRQVPRDSRKSGESRPPDHDPSKHGPRAEPIRQPAARDLEQHVPEHEAGSRQADLFQGEPEFRRHFAGRRAEADPVQVGDHHQDEQESQRPVADGHEVPLYDSPAAIVLEIAYADAAPVRAEVNSRSGSGTPIVSGAVACRRLMPRRRWPSEAETPHRADVRSSRSAVRRRAEFHLDFTDRLIVQPGPHPVSGHSTNLGPGVLEVRPEGHPDGNRRPWPKPIPRYGLPPAPASRSARPMRKNAIPP